MALHECNITYKFEDGMTVHSSVMTHFVLGFVRPGDLGRPGDLDVFT